MSTSLPSVVEVKSKVRRRLNFLFLQVVCMPFFPIVACFFLRFCISHSSSCPKVRFESGTCESELHLSVDVSGSNFVNFRNISVQF